MGVILGFSWFWCGLDGFARQGAPLLPPEGATIWWFSAHISRTVGARAVLFAVLDSAPQGATSRFPSIFGFLGIFRSELIFLRKDPFTWLDSEGLSLS